MDILAAKAIGYGSCSVISFARVRAADLINILGDNVIVFIVTVGNALKAAALKADQLHPTEVVVQDRFA